MQKPTMTHSELREQRLQALLESCKDQVLQQVIGPFGLNPAMFEDKQGGSVTTTHNFEQGVVSTELDRERHEEWRRSQNGGYNREPYDVDLPGKRKSMLQSDAPIHSAYTGNELPRDGRTHLDHVVAAKRIETDSRANLYKSRDERVAMANAPENLVPAESSINQSMQDMDKRTWADKERKKDPGKTNAESFGVDRQRLEDTVQTAERHVNREVLMAQLSKQGSELATTGAKEAGKNALRQAIGIALHVFVNQSFIELKGFFDRPDGGNLVDDLTAALKRVVTRVTDRLRTILDAGIGGAIQGFISNLLTFLINNFITTSAKLVSVIREGMTSLWRAIKMMVSPPADITGLEIAREVSKIIAGVVTTSLGLIFEEAITGALMAAAPLLAPLMKVIAPAVTAILVGVVSALVVYGLDRFFDWLSDAGTALLQVMEANMDALKGNLANMAQWIEQQYVNSERYAAISCEYRLIEIHLANAEKAQSVAIADQKSRINNNQNFMINLSASMAAQNTNEKDVLAMLEDYRSKEGE
jgi:hypothetical protein